MTNEKETDIYLQLINDMLDNPLSEEEIKLPILQDIDIDEGSPAWKLNKSLTNSCKKLRKAIGTENIVVGAQDGYVEPCPISYTGSVVTGDDKFRVVFIGLNPFLEGPRQFTPDTSYADLANIHHPHDIIHATGKNYNKCHQYRRILGCRENRTDWGAWSPFYKDVIRIYLAFLPDNNSEWYSTWPDLQEKGKSLAVNPPSFDDEDIKHKRVHKDFIASMSLQNYLLKKLKDNPLASAELIPYKSENFHANQLIKLLNKEGHPFHEKYCRYFWDIFRFIEKHAYDDAYVVITARKSDIEKLNDFFVKCETSCIGIPKFEFEQKFIFKDKIPFYLLKWRTDNNYRRIVIMPSISRQSSYGQILQNIGTEKGGWIYEIKKAFGDMLHVS